MPVTRKLTKKRRVTKVVIPKYTLKNRTRAIQMQNGAGLFNWMFAKSYKHESLYVTNKVMNGLPVLQSFDKDTQQKFKKGLYYIIKAQLTTDKYRNRYISTSNKSNNRSAQHVPFRKKLVDIFKHLNMKSTPNGGYEPVINTKNVKKNEPPLTNYVDTFVRIIIAFFGKLQIDTSIRTVHDIPTPNASETSQPVYYVAQGAKIGKVYFFDIGSYEAVEPVLFQLIRTDLGGASSSDKSERKYRHRVVNTFTTLYGSYAKALSNYINYTDLKSQGTLTNRNQFHGLY